MATLLTALLLVTLLHPARPTATWARAGLGKTPQCSATYLKSLQYRATFP